MEAEERVQQIQEIQDRIQNRIAREAHPADVQKKICSLCDGKGFQRITRDGYPYIAKCVCRKEEERLKLLRDSGIPIKFWNTTLAENPNDNRERFRIWGKALAKKSQETALKTCRDLCQLYLKKFMSGEDVEDLYGLILYGNCGRGKSRLAASLLVDLIHQGMTSVRFVEYNELFKQIRFSYGGAELTYEAIFNRLINVKVLVIDDFGMEVSGDHVWVLDNIGYIINERYVTNRPTILTTNYWRPLDDAKRGESVPENVYENTPSWELRRHMASQKVDKEDEVYQDRVSYRLRSRISEMCLQVKLEGDDYRKKISRIRELRLEKNRLDASRSS